MIEAEAASRGIEVDGYAANGCMYDRSSCEGNICLLVCIFVGLM